MDYCDIKIGDSASMERAYTMEDLLMFSDLSLDKNPIHLDPEYGRQSMYKDNIVHGLLVASLISGVLSEKLPGHGTIYMSQDLQFLQPVYLGKKCIARVEVMEKQDEHHILILKTTISVEEESNVVAEGEAVVKKI